MAKGDSSTSKPQTSGFTPSQMPQQNQTLSGNPSTDTQAQTRWMDPNQSIQNTGINGGAQQPGSSTQPIVNGTMLGQITAGNQGQYMPGGYDQGKFNDPNKHDPKYDIGRILSKYPPGPQGLDSAMNELSSQGFQRVGKDSVYRQDVGTVDVGKSFGSGDPSQMAWQWNPSDQGGMSPQGNQGSMLGIPQQGMNQNDTMNQIFQALMARRNQFANQQFNPTGGQLQFPVNNPMTQYANNPQSPPMFANQQQAPPMYGGGFTGFGNQPLIGAPNTMLQPLR